MDYTFEIYLGRHLILFPAATITDSVQWHMTVRDSKNNPLVNFLGCVWNDDDPLSSKTRILVDVYEKAAEGLEWLESVDWSPGSDTIRRPHYHGIFELIEE